MRQIPLWRIRKAAVVFLVLYSLTYYGLLILFPAHRIRLSDLFGLLGDGISLAVVGFGLYWQKTGHKVEWGFFALGIGLTFAGDFSWSVYEILLQQEVPFPSVCDIFYLGASVCCFFALIYYIRREKLFDLVRMGFDIAITMTAGTTIIFKYVLLPISADVTMTFWQKAIAMAYPIFDIGYLGGIFSLISCAPKSRLNRQNLLISGAFLIWFLADEVYLVLVNYTYVSGGFLDPLWPVGCWVLALASLYPPYRETDGRDISLTGRSNRLRLLWEYVGFLFPYISAGLIILLVSYQYISKDPLVTGTVITVLLILMRQIFSLLENKRLIHLIQQSNQLLEENKMELEEKNKELQQLNYLKEREANTDFLTGIFNRRYIDEMMRDLPKLEMDDEKMEISVLLIDIDYFKQINDRWGHETGDAVLRQVALLIQEAIRAEDIAGRFGGDEFIVILPNTDLQYAEHVAERLRKKVASGNFTGTDVNFKVTLSIGCTKWKGLVNEFDINSVISNADMALYRAKADGRDRCQTAEA